MKMKMCIAALALGVASMAYADLGLFYSYQDTKDMGAGSGGGLKYDIPLNRHVSVDARATIITSYDVRQPTWTADIDMIPIELNVNLKYPVARMLPYIGGGVGYYYFHPSWMDEEIGYNIHAGVSVGIAGGMDVFAEVKYQFLEVDGSHTFLDKSERYKINADGVGVIAGLLIRF